jgi:glycosyltransferase involved in cell wall biosynthesis
LLTDEPLRLRLGARSREVAAAEYTAELQARRFKQLYEDILKSRNRVAASA